MKNWFVPATLLGLSGLALVFASEKGRERVRHFLDDLDGAWRSAERIQQIL